MTMKTLTIDRVHGRDLKPQWAEEAQVGPDEEISIRSFEQSLVFINENIRKKPDFELLKDWVDGEVELRGRGRVRANLSRAVE